MSSWWIHGWPPVMVFQQHDVVFIVYSWLLLLQDGINPSTQTRNFRLPSTTMCLCKFLCLCRFCYIHMNLFIWSNLLSISWSRFSSMMDFIFSTGFQLRIFGSAFQTCTFYGIVGFSSLNPTRLPLILNLGDLPHWPCRFDDVFPVSRILAQST
jgi:hypothetical protein